VQCLEVGGGLEGRGLERARLERGVQLQSGGMQPGRRRPLGEDRRLRQDRPGLLLLLMVVVVVGEDSCGLGKDRAGWQRHPWLQVLLRVLLRLLRRRLQ